MAFQVTSQAPDANVIFYPFVREETRDRPPADLEVREIQAHNHIIDLQTTKPKGGTGHFSILLSSERNWKSILNPGSWCVIYLSDRRLTGNEGSEEDSGFKMFGIIRSVRRQETVTATGQKKVRYLVSGDDFHSVLDIPVYINIHLTQTQNGQQIPGAGAFLLFGKRFEQIVTPDKVIKALVDSLLGRPAFEADRTNSEVNLNSQVLGARQGEPYRLPSAAARRIFLNRRAASNFFTGLLTFFLQKDLIGKYFNKSEVPPGVHSLWSILQSYSHRLLNELYTDLLPVSVFGKTILLPSIVLRSIPFSPPFRQRRNGANEKGLISMVEAGGNPNATNKAPATRSSGVAVSLRERTKAKTEVGPGRGAHFYVSRDIVEAEILSFNSGKTDRERFNFFLVTPNLGSGGVGEASILTSLLTTGVNQAADLNSIGRYGLRPFITQSNYIAAKAIDKDLLRVNRICQDLWDRAHLFESGQVVLTGSRYHIPVGTNIRFKERDWIAHVEQVEHSYKVDEATGIKQFRTVVSFVRLQTLAGDPVDVTEYNTPYDDKGVLQIGDKIGIDRGVGFVPIDEE